MRKLATLRLGAIVATGGLYLALAGCGGVKPQPSESEEKDKKGSPKGEAPEHRKESTPASPTVLPRKVDLDSGVGKEAAAFLKALGEGDAKADSLSAEFVKLIGRPAELPGDRVKGYSRNAAERWMREVGKGIGFGLPLDFKSYSVFVVCKGRLVGKPGEYYLRLVNTTERPNDPGVWKVDWLSLTSAEAKGLATDAIGEIVTEQFAATAVFTTICDRDAMTRDDRIAVIAAGMTPALLTKLAEPFGSDKDQGLDYNRGKLALEVGKIGDKAESVSFTPQGEAAFKAEVTRAGGARSAYLVKLAKGAAPGQWLVDSITAQ